MHKCGANPLYLASIAIGSFLLGGAVGLWLSKDEEDIFEENCIKIEDISEYHYNEDELNEIRDRYLDKKESYSNMIKEIYPDDYTENPNLDYSDFFEKTDDDEFNIQYGENEEEIQEVVDTEVPEEEDDIVEVIEDPSKSPYVISLEEYHVDNGYMQETVIYYADDDILADERDEVIYDITNTVGKDALDNFGNGSGDDDTVFVRNDRLRIDYEIIKEDLSYQESVLGITMDDEEALNRAKNLFKKRSENNDETYER